MNKRKYVQQRRSSWRQFRDLIDRAESRRERKRMSPIDLADYSRLLREVSNDLAIVRAREWGRELADYLNSLVTRGYNNYYTSPPGNVRKFVQFIIFGFPVLMRKNWPFMLAGWCLFFIPFIVSWGVIQTDSSLAVRILPAEHLEQMEQMYETPLYGGDQVGDDEEALDSESSEDEPSDSAVSQEDQMVADGYLDERSTMAGFYINNNVGIALRSFAIGILLGIGTCYVLLYNGLVLGASFGYTLAVGHGDNLLSFAVTHGSFELTAIAISGGAGLMLGDAIIHRRNRTLFESQKVRGLDAIKIALGAGVMLVVAAFIEAFWSPAPIDHTIKYVVGITSWVFVYAWMFLAGRGRVPA